MSINGITSVTTPPPAASPRTPPAAERGTGHKAEPEIDKATGQPVAPRFPWLSRITRELERASNQSPPYQAAPLIGENLDKSA